MTLVTAKYAIWVIQWDWRFIRGTTAPWATPAARRPRHDGGARRTIYTPSGRLKDEPAGREVDHINGFHGLDNQWHNLRESTRVQNGRSSGAHEPEAGSSRGYAMVGSRWRKPTSPPTASSITSASFDTAEAAASRYRQGGRNTSASSLSPQL